MISVTKAAVIQIMEMAKEQDTPIEVLRFGVTGGGCSGLTYALGFSKETNEDEVYYFDGLGVVVNKNDLPVVKGTVIDYKQNLLGGGFTIDNPNATISCGCGTSFRTKENTGTPEEC